jgi:hypothetical protein
MADGDAVLTFRTSQADAAYVRGLADGRGVTRSDVLRQLVRGLASKEASEPRGSTTSTD